MRFFGLPQDGLDDEKNRTPKQLTTKAKEPGEVRVNKGFKNANSKVKSSTQVQTQSLAVHSQFAHKVGNKNTVFRDKNH